LLKALKSSGSRPPTNNSIVVSKFPSSAIFRIYRLNASRTSPSADGPLRAAGRAQNFMSVKTKTKIVPAKIMPVDAEPELEASPSALTSLTPNPLVEIAGETVAEDFGTCPRLSLVSATSSLADEIPPGQWAISNGLGAAVALGPRIEIVPLQRTKWWLMDFGQGEAGGPPVRFKTEEEVRQFGGCNSRQPEPGKLAFSRSMEIRLLVTSQHDVPETYLQLPVGTHAYPVALYEAARSAFRVVGVGLNLYLTNTSEKEWERKWKLGVSVRKNRNLNTTYFVPSLERGEPTSAAERLELSRLVERQLPA